MDLTTENHNRYGLVGIALRVGETKMHRIAPHVETPSTPEGNENELGNVARYGFVGVYLGLGLGLGLGRLIRFGRGFFGTWLEGDEWMGLS